MGSIITSGTKSRSGYSKTKSRKSPSNYERRFQKGHDLWNYNPDNIMSMNNRSRQWQEGNIRKRIEAENAAKSSSVDPPPRVDLSGGSAKLIYPKRRN